MKPAALRQRIRAAAGGHREPIRIIPGNSRPCLKGDSFGWCTRTGMPVRYPMAYSKVGWSSLRYVPSSREVVVGEDWPIPGTNFTAGMIEPLEILLKINSKGVRNE